MYFLSQVIEEKYRWVGDGGILVYCRLVERRVAVADQVVFHNSGIGDL